MAGSGRKPFISVDAVPYGMANQRLKPPKTLGDLEKQAFLDLVSSCPSGQFQEADKVLLSRHAELVVLCEQAFGEMRAGGMVTADGKPSPWWSIYRDACKELRSLATRLRLGPSSRASKAPKTLPARMSYYERAALMEDDGDDAEPS
jgi:phage terminase small subunit